MGRGDRRKDSEVRRFEHDLLDRERGVRERRVEGAVRVLNRGAADERSIHRTLDDAVFGVKTREFLWTPTLLGLDVAVDNRLEVGARHGRHESLPRLLAEYTPRL
jgi:hypothetical protein